MPGAAWLTFFSIKSHHLLSHCFVMDGRSPFGTLLTERDRERNGVFWEQWCDCWGMVACFYDAIVPFFFPFFDIEPRNGNTCATLHRFPWASAPQILAEVSDTLPIRWMMHRMRKSVVAASRRSVGSRFWKSCELWCVYYDELEVVWWGR